ncbi:elements of external origin [Ralstonia solanacearum]|nr:elements of external origin [Ralstonia solanacearum]
MAQNGITAVLCLAVFSVRGNVVELFRMGGGDTSWLVRLLRRSA